MFHHALIVNQPISDLLIHIVSEKNKFIDLLYLNIFPRTVSYLWTDYKNCRSTVAFASLLLTQYNPVIVFAGDSIKLLYIRQNFSQLIAVVGNQTVLIPFDVNYGYSFKVWDRVQLFLHASFSGSKYNYVCENNESYHKLAKQYRLLYDSFDVWFSIDGMRETTPSIDFFVLELALKVD
jgi:hypothetical protein